MTETAVVTQYKNSMWDDNTTLNYFVYRIYIHNSHLPFNSWNVKQNNLQGRCIIWATGSEPYFIFRNKKCIFGIGMADSKKRTQLMYTNSEKPVLRVAV